VTPTATRQQRRRDALRHFRSELACGAALIGAGVGSGLTARAALDGGADFLVAYHSATLRLAGLPSVAGLLPIGDANKYVLDMATPILTAADETRPVLATVYAADPLRPLATHLDALAALGFAGILNAPTAGLIDGNFRRQLEAAHLGFTREIALMREAHAADLLTAAYVFDAEQARTLVDAGVDVLIIHLGETSSSLELSHETIGLVAGIADVADSSNGDILILCHGGALRGTPEVSELLSEVPRLQGYFGASPIERVPITEAVREATRQFKRLRTRRLGYS
jgi:predicted TIM-barrel enzyme